MAVKVVVVVGEVEKKDNAVEFSPTTFLEFDGIMPAIRRHIRKVAEKEEWDNDRRLRALETVRKARNALKHIANAGGWDELGEVKIYEDETVFIVPRRATGRVFKGIAHVYGVGFEVLPTSAPGLYIRAHGGSD